MKRTLYGIEKFVAVGIIAIVIVLYLLASTYQPSSPIRQFIGIFSFEWLESVLVVGSIISLIYPAYVLKKIAPKVSNSFDAPPITAMLPYSKKQLFWNGIKGWLIFFPIFLIITIGLYVTAAYKIETLSLQYHYQLSVDVYDGQKLIALFAEQLPFYFIQLILTTALVLVFMSNTMIHFIKSMDRYQYITLNIMSFIIVSLTVLSGYSQLEMSHNAFVLLVLFTMLTGYFIYAFKKIELLYQ